MVGLLIMIHKSFRVNMDSFEMSEVLVNQQIQGANYVDLVPHISHCGAIELFAFFSKSDYTTEIYRVNLDVMEFDYHCTMDGKLLAAASKNEYLQTDLMFETLSIQNLDITMKIT